MSQNIITNTSLVQIKDEIAKQNNILKSFVNLYAKSPWDAVQANVRAGKASDIYNIGDELLTTYHDLVGGVDYDFPWLVVDIDRPVTLADGTIRKAIILQAKYATLEEIQFDAAENYTVDSSQEPNALEGWYYWGLTGSTYTKLDVATGDALPFGDYDSIHKCGIDNLDVLRYGYNRYSHSAQRQWLNSAAGINEWWEAKHFGDKAPNQLGSRYGFLAGFDDDFLNVLTPIMIKTATNAVTDNGVTDITYDKIWLPSLEEMYGSPQAAGVEGAYFPYWKQITGLNSPSNGSSTDTNDARKIKSINAPTGSAVYVRLRSAIRGYAYYVWGVTTAGYFTLNNNATNAYRGLPACAIC